MKKSYPKTDNVNIAVRGLACDSEEAGRLDRSIFDKKWFYSVCVDVDGEHRDGEEGQDKRPVVYVNSPNVYFNITKSALFQDVIFDGINAFAAIEESAGGPTNGTKSAPK